MEERNVMSGILFSDFLGPLRWFLLLGLILIFADLRFGVAASRRRGEIVRLSRAIRRTVNKMVDYVCWVLVAGCLGHAFGEPLGIPILPALVLLVIFGCELNSLFNNFFEAHGKRFRVDVFKFFSKKTDIIEVSDGGRKKGSRVDKKV